MPLLPFISNDELIIYTKQVLDKVSTAYNSADDKLYSNVVDPFSALFDSMRQGIAVEDWLNQERSRQVQKTLQNAVGDFHQNILGSIPGWENSGRGGGYDLINHDRKILAEVKNKFNTMNSSSAESTYRKLARYIDGDYQGYTGYVVFIVPKNARDYDSSWSPNQATMPLRNDIRKADGESFYGLVTGHNDALEDLYDVMPHLIARLLNVHDASNADYAALKKLFTRAYK